MLNHSITINEHHSLPSTNDELYKLAKDGAKHASVVCAREQTNGKGTKGRSFFSPNSTGIYMSILLREVPSEFVGFVTPFAATVVSKVLDSICNVKTEIKWVNDVYLEGKKVCGILTKGEFIAGKCDFVIVGIGINLAKPEGDFPDDIANTAGYILENADECKRICLIREIAKKLADFNTHVKTFEFLNDYRQKSNIISKWVQVNEFDKSYQALVKSIDDNCHLIVENEKGETISLASGEVSIKVSSQKES